MIKTIKKIDIHGNETWQEVYACNRCKRILGEDEYVYTTKWKSYFPVKPKGVVACGFSEGSNPDIHICENCSNDVQRFWNGECTTDEVEDKETEIQKLLCMIDNLKDDLYEYTHISESKYYYGGK